MEALAAFELAHESVEVPPAAMLAGTGFEGANGRGGAADTLTVACLVTVPAGPVRVSVYVVVLAGDTLTEPPATGVTVPTVGVIEAPVALALVQNSVAEPPGAIVVDVGVNVPVGSGVTTTLACLVVVPPAPLSVNV